MATIEDCIKAIESMNKDFSKEEIKHRANWLYMMNRISFWNDLPIMLEIINYEVNQVKNNDKDERNNSSRSL